MPRPKTFNTEEVLRKSMELLWEKGHANTTIDDLVEYTKVGRYGLYSSFGNKRELLARALELYGSSMMAPRIWGLESDTANLGDIFAFFELSRDWSLTKDGQRGCLMCSVADDKNSKGDLNSITSSWLERVRLAFMNALSNAKQSGDLAKGFDIEGYALYLTSLVTVWHRLCISKKGPEEIHTFFKYSLCGLPHEKTIMTRS